MSSPTPAAPPRPDRLEPAKVYLILALVFGLLMTAASPPFQAPDEYEHFFRIFQLTQGDLLAEKHQDSAGGQIPVLVASIASTGNLAGHPENKADRAYFAPKSNVLWTDWSQSPRHYEHFPHTVVYAPLGYLPQITAVFLGKLAHLGPLPLFYLSRLASLLASITLAYFALRSLPSRRWAGAFFLLSPTALFFFTSCAPDGLLISGAFFLTARLLRAHLVPGDLPGRAETAFLLFLGAVLPVTKFVYLPVSALIPLLLWSRLPNLPARLRLAAGWGVCCLLPSLAWAKVIASSFIRGRHDIPIDPYAQIQHVLGDPFGLLQLVITSFTGQLAYLYHSLIGVLGWNDTPMPAWFYPAYGLAFLALLLGDARPTPRWPVKLLLLATALGTLLILYTALYVQWNAPGSTQPIDGMVGRYLFPALPALLFALPALPASPRFDQFLPRAAATFCLVSAGVAVWSTFARFYLP